MLDPKAYETKVLTYMISGYLPKLIESQEEYDRWRRLIEVKAKEGNLSTETMTFLRLAALLVVEYEQRAIVKQPLLKGY